MGLIEGRGLQVLSVAMRARALLTKTVTTMESPIVPVRPVINYLESVRRRWDVGICSSRNGV